MLALAQAFEQAKKKDVGAVIKMDEWEADSLGISVEVLHMWKEGFRQTYEVAKVETLEHGFKMPKFKRSGWKACGNY